VDEIYGEDDAMARYAFRLDGTLVASSDENSPHAALRLVLPPNLTKPANVRQDHPLHFSGARWRGMQDDDRVQDLVQPLSIAEKLAVSNFVNVPPPWLIGLAESVVLAEAPLARPGLFVICRRLRLAYRLPTEQKDEHNLPYNYDSKTLSLVHFYDDRATDELDLIAATQGLPGPKLNRPMDCMVWQSWLLVADGAAESHPSAVHIWHIDENETLQVAASETPICVMLW
jgi:hypothetical protein